MGGWQHNFFQGNSNISDISNSVEQIEHEVSSLMDRHYDFGENQTPFTFNGKNVYVYKFNPSETLTLPPTDYLIIERVVMEEVISVNLFGKINNWEVGVEWFQLPMVKRGGGQQVLFAISPQGFPIIKNYVVTGPCNIKGYFVYTK